MASVDISLFYWIHSLAGRSTLLDAVIVFFATYLIYVVIVGMVCLVAHAWYMRKREKSLGYLVALAAAVAARFVVASGIRISYERPRPFLALGISHLLTDSAYSFPSGHTIFMFALATVTYRYNKTLSWLLAATGLLIGLARVAGGVHYPSDILGGIVLGILIGLVVSVLHVRLTSLFSLTKLKRRD